MPETIVSTISKFFEERWWERDLIVRSDAHRCSETEVKKKKL